MYPSELMLFTKLVSTTLLMEPPPMPGRIAKSSVVNVTLSDVPGAPAGDQFPPEDQRVSAAVPFQVFGAAMAGFVVVSAAVIRARFRRRRFEFFMSGWSGFDSCKHKSEAA